MQFRIGTVLVAGVTVMAALGVDRRAVRAEGA
jgi:hypothetical protein